MKTFLTPARLWAPGASYLHVYAVPDLYSNPQLSKLIDDATAALNAFPFVAAMDPQWRHMTVASTNTEGPLPQAAVEHLMSQIAAVPSFDILMGSPMASTSAVMLDSYDEDAGFARLEAAAVTALQEACGDGVPGGGRATWPSATASRAVDPVPSTRGFARPATRLTHRGMWMKS